MFKMELSNYHESTCLHVGARNIRELLKTIKTAKIIKKMLLYFSNKLKIYMYFNVASNMYLS